MVSDPCQTTRATLLAKLRDPDNRPVWNQAWKRFFDQYSPLMLVWCRRLGLQDGDAQEITANVLLRLGRRMRYFDYDPTRRFRSWLRQVVHNEVLDFFARRARRPGDYTAGGSEALDQVPDRGAAAEELVQHIETNRYLLDRALGEVRRRVAPQTWVAFSGVAVEERPAADVAAELGMTQTAVYQAKCRVVQMIRQVVDQLRGDTPAA